MAKDRKLKILAPFITFAFILPIVTAFCCCLELSGSKKNSHSHDVTVASNHEDTYSHHNHQNENPYQKTNDESDCGQHDHSECNHPQLITNFVNNATPFFATHISYLQKFLRNHLKELIFFRDSLKSESSPLFLNTGPPVFDSNNTPLYLQISVLRI